MKTTGYPIKNAIGTQRETGRVGASARSHTQNIRRAVHFIYEPVFYDTPAALYTKVRWDSKLYCGAPQLTLIKKSGARAGKTPKSHRLSSNCKSKMEE